MARRAAPRAGLQARRARARAAHGTPTVARATPSACACAACATTRGAVEPGDLFVARARRAAPTARASWPTRWRAARRPSWPRAGRSSADVARACPVLVVDDPAAALGLRRRRRLRAPTFALEVVGITGTNGKTTTAHLVRAADRRRARRPRCGILGHASATASATGAPPAEHTTPEADELARIVAAMRARGATHVAMEVSSHALELGRVRAVRFRVAAFTNLTQDHLDFHGSMEAYAAAKARLFTELGAGGGRAQRRRRLRPRARRSRAKAPLVPRERAASGEPTPADIAPRRGRASTRRGIALDGRARRRATVVHPLAPRRRAQPREPASLALGIAARARARPRRARPRRSRARAGAPGRLERCDAPGRRRDGARRLRPHPRRARAGARRRAAPWRAGACGASSAAAATGTRPSAAPMGEAVAPARRRGHRHQRQPAHRGPRGHRRRRRRRASARPARSRSSSSTAGRAIDLAVRSASAATWSWSPARATRTIRSWAP